MSRYHGVLSGPKFPARGHSTFLDTAYPVIMAAKALDEVKRIVVGFITPNKRGQPHLKFVELPVGLKVVVKGEGCIQEFYVYSADVDHTKRALQEAWDKAS